MINSFFHQNNLLTLLISTYFLILQCSGELPRCARCVKADIDCDIVDNVYYNYETVSSLMAKVAKLESKVKMNENLQSSNSPYQSTNIEMNYNNNQTLSPPKTTSPYGKDKLRNSLTASTTSNGTSSSKNKESTIEDISTSVGSLSLDNINGSNSESKHPLGRSSFSRLFLRQLHLDELGVVNVNLGTDNFEEFDKSITQPGIPLPPFRIAKFAIFKYINTVHIYYPFLSIKTLKVIFNKMYSSPQELTMHDKFLVYIVISIGLDRGEKDTFMSSYVGQFKPVEYFNTAYRHLEEILSVRSEKTLKALLLVIIWLLNTDVLKEENGDLWHLGRFAMSLAMELGTHRYNPEWDFGTSRNELRNRLFWCTYILERNIALKYSSSLSLRKQAIDTPLPIFLENDFIAELSPSDASSPLLVVYDKVQFKPSLFLINICEIYGDILENFYTPQAKFNNPAFPDQEIFNIKLQLQNSLDQWILQVSSEIPNNLNCYYGLKIRYSAASIILNRPSPAIRTPDIESILKCKIEAEICIDNYCCLLDNYWKVTNCCIYDLKLVGLTMIYCCWKTEQDSRLLNHFTIKISKVFNEVVKYYPSFTKFKNLYSIISSIVRDGIDSSENTFSNPTQQIQLLKQRSQYPIAYTKLDSNNPIINFDDWFTKELYQDVFKQYSFDENDAISQDLDLLFS